MKSVTDLRSLHYMAHVSPAYHETYLRAKEDILSTLATRELIRDKVDLLDPYHRYQSSKDQPGGHSSDDQN